MLVVTASRYGATTEIGAAIAEELRERGIDAEALDVEAVTNEALERAEAVVIGSAVYMGRWLREARDFVDQHAERLRERPVWLFSSGPIGHPPVPEEQVDVSALVTATDAREHAIFSGRLKREGMRFVDRAVVAALRAPDGDFRDWTLIRGWARDIARELQGGVAPA